MPGPSLLRGLAGSNPTNKLLHLSSSMGGGPRLAGAAPTAPAIPISTPIRRALSSTIGGGGGGSGSIGGGGGAAATPAFLGGGGSKSSGGGGGGVTVYGAAAGVRPGAPVVAFDTYRVHQQLQEAGFTKRQAEVVVELVVAGMEESTLRSTALIATKRDLVDLKQELQERVFNSSMRFEIGQRHAKEMVEKDLLSQKSDILAKLNVETQRVERLIVEMEKTVTDRHLTRRELTEQRVTVLQNEIAQVEKRILQYGAGTLISLLTVGLGFARLVM